MPILAANLFPIWFGMTEILKHSNPSPSLDGITEVNGKTLDF